jgi:hypothetical protein
VVDAVPSALDADSCRPQLRKVSLCEDSIGGGVLALPCPRAALRHAVPVVLEGVLVPIALFYVILLTLGFRGAIIAALAWSSVALARRVRNGERPSMLLLLGTALLALRTGISFFTGSSFVYFVQPAAGTILIALVLLGSAVIGRPFTQRFAHDFCPIDPELLARPLVQRFFVRISVLWASVLLVNAGLVLWLLLTSSLHAFVLERTAITWSLTALAITLSITRFIAAMRSEGFTVQWGGTLAAVQHTLR